MGERAALVYHEGYLSYDFGPGHPMRQARIALCGVGPMALRARRSESALEGLALTEEALEAAAQEVDGEIDPASDIHASGEYRRHVAKVLIKRALRNAWQRAGGGA